MGPTPQPRLHVKSKVLTIKITNAPTGWNPFCSEDRADRYIKQGRAIRTSRFHIRLLPEHHAHLNCTETQKGYDSINASQVWNLNNVPVVKARELYAPKGRLSTSARRAGAKLPRQQSAR